MITEKINTVYSLIVKAKEAKNATDALHYSQAALNAANALAVARDGISEILVDGVPNLQYREQNNN